VSSTFVAQSLIVSEMASFSVPRPVVTGVISEPFSRIRNTLGRWRLMSRSPM
jgi:hypothetical protein